MNPVSYLSGPPHALGKSGIMEKDYCLSAYDLNLDTTITDVPMSIWSFT